jgi:Holliday junction resolvase
MTNQYRRGANHEYAIVHDLREKGYTAQRTAGSHSPVDVFAVPLSGNGLLFCQAKLGNMTKSARRDFWQFCQRAGADSLIAIKRKEGRRSELRYLRVMSDGEVVDVAIGEDDSGHHDLAGQGTEAG